MGYCGREGYQKYYLLFNIVILFCNNLTGLVALPNPNPPVAKNAKQFPNLSFAYPVAGLFGGNSGAGNIFAKNTVTKTLISTVTTVTVPSWRTCTVPPMAAAFPACAGKRKRRDTDGDVDDSANAIDLNDRIYASPSIKLIIGTTEITDPAAVAQILHLDVNNMMKKQSEDIIDSTDATTARIPSDLERGDDIPLTTSNYQVFLDPSEDSSTTAAEVLSQEAISDDSLVLSPEGRDGLNSNSADIIVTTGETPYSDDINRVEDATTTDSTPLDHEENEKGRLGVGGRNGGASTVTTTIPVTHVVSTIVTADKSTLTVMYMGCSPPGPLPVIASACPA